MTTNRNHGVLSSGCTILITCCVHCGGGFPIGNRRIRKRYVPEMSAALQFAADLVQDEDRPSVSSLGLEGWLCPGQGVMSFLPEWATARLNKVEGLEYDVAPIPQGSEGSVTSFASSGVAMGTWCTDFQRSSWEVVKWFAHADYGEWAVAQAFLFPEGLPTAPYAQRMNTAGLRIMIDRRTGASSFRTLRRQWFPSQTVRGGHIFLSIDGIKINLIGGP